MSDENLLTQDNNSENSELDNNSENSELDITEVIKNINEYNIIEKYNQIISQITDLKNKQYMIRDKIKIIQNLYSFNNKMKQLKQYQDDIDFENELYTNAIKEKFKKIDYDPQNDPIDKNTYYNQINQQTRFFVNQQQAENKMNNFAFQNTILFIGNEEEV